MQELIVGMENLAFARPQQQAGVHVTDAPRHRFWGGYAGSFQDPDGHMWEIAWNPDWEVPK